MDLVRAGLDMRAGRWKATLVGFGLLSASVMGLQAFHAVALFESGVQGALGITTEPAAPGHSFTSSQARVVRKIEPWSRVPEAGIQVGDVLVVDRWYDRSRTLRGGEVVGASLRRGGESTRVQLPTAARPVEAHEKLHFALNAVLCALGTVIGLVIGFRQPGQLTSRALALAFLWWSMNLGAAYVPPHWPQVFVRVMNDAALLPGWYLGLWFAIHYPDGLASHWRVHLRRLLPVLLVAVVVGVGLGVAAALGRLPGQPVSIYWTAYVGLTGLLILVAFWDGWRQSSGLLRQRFLWLLATFGLFYVASYSTYLDSALELELGAPLFLFSVLGSMTMYLGLAYAILRLRVIDLGLALNRSLTYTVVGAVLLGSFHFLQLIVGRVLHFADPARAGLVSGLLAVVVMLAFPKLKPRAEWLIDRLFFGDWVAREVELNRFADDAGGYTDAGAMASALVRAIDRFVAGAGCAIYVRAADGRFDRPHATLAAAPAVLPADEPAAVSLRAGRPLLRCDEVRSDLPGELVFALVRQRSLEAFVLVGRLRDGRPLRADELNALGKALERVGAQWQALRWEALQRQQPAAGATPMP